ncbi:MAG: ABC transporter permease, partial [Rhodobacteraceae bacterium]|nr:ABC transporter permease [Paracoccaceae bacterium]
MTPSNARSTALMAPALAWLTALMVVPCGLILALGFFRRGIYGGIEYTFTLENFGLLLDPLYAGIFLTSARIAGTATLIAVVIGYAAAYAIAAAPRHRQPFLLFLAVL